MNELENFPAYKTRVMESHVNYLDSSTFKSTTFSYSNPGGVGIFSVVDRRTLEPKIFVDKERLETLVSKTDGGNFEDILPFILEHEVREAYVNTSLLLGKTSRSSVQGNTNHNDSTYEAMKLALQSGKLDKYLEFLEKVQELASAQTAEYFDDDTQDNQADYFNRLHRDLATRVRLEAVQSPRI